MISDETKLVEINEAEDIVEALEVLAGAALIKGNRNLWAHIFAAAKAYQKGVVHHAASLPPDYGKD